MNEHKEILYWQEMSQIIINQVLHVAPLSNQPIFYDYLNDQYFSGNPDNRFISIDTLKRLMTSHDIIRFGGLLRAETRERTTDWRKKRDEHNRLLVAIHDVKLCRGVILEKA